MIQPWKISNGKGLRRGLFRQASGLSKPFQKKHPFDKERGDISLEKIYTRDASIRPQEFDEHFEAREGGTDESEKREQFWGSRSEAAVERMIQQ